MFQEIAARLDAVTPPRSLRELWDLHRWHEAGEPSFSRIAERWTHPGRREQRFLNQNTWLMDITGIPKGFSEAHKPATMSRASALGGFLSEHVDLVLLQEVWEERHRRRILDDWGTPEPSSAVGVEGRGVRPRADGSAVGSAAIIGPILTGLVLPFDPSGGAAATAFGVSAGAALDPLRLDNAIGDGLMMISRDAELEDVDTHSFEHEGTFPAEDIFAEKGILRATVRLGTGRDDMALELYTTHLTAQSGDEGDATRKEQIDELCAFVGEASDDVIRIVAGDFNIGLNSDPHDHLFTALGRLDLEEITATAAWRDRISHDFHTSLDESRLWAADCVWPAEAWGSHYVEEEPGFPEAETSRLDYCFVDLPRKGHRFDLDFTRPRRVRIRRSRAARDALCAPLVSDHLGIATTLLLTPR